MFPFGKLSKYRSFVPNPGPSSSKKPISTNCFTLSVLRDTSDDDDDEDPFESQGARLPRGPLAAETATGTRLGYPPEPLPQPLMQYSDDDHYYATYEIAYKYTDMETSDPWNFMVSFDVRPPRSANARDWRTRIKTDRHREALQYWLGNLPEFGEQRDFACSKIGLAGYLTSFFNLAKDTFRGWDELKLKINLPDDWIEPLQGWTEDDISQAEVRKIEEYWQSLADTRSDGFQTLFSAPAKPSCPETEESFAAVSDAGA